MSKFYINRNEAKKGAEFRVSMMLGRINSFNGFKVGAHFSRKLHYGSTPVEEQQGCQGVNDLRLVGTQTSFICCNS